MVSWIYSEPYIGEFLAGVTRGMKSGRIALKMVLARKKCATEFFSREEHLNLSKLLTDRKNIH